MNYKVGDRVFVYSTNISDRFDCYDNKYGTIVEISQGDCRVQFDNDEASIWTTELRHLTLLEKELESC